jgi:hypothetical protein
MLLVTVDVENVLIEFHHTPTASEGECYGRLLREWHSDFGDEAQRLTLMGSRIHPMGFPKQSEIGSADKGLFLRCGRAPQLWISDQGKL